MPNHVHGIIELISEPVGAENFPPNKNGMNDVNGAENFPPLRVTSKTIGSIVRGFKIGVTKWFRNNTYYKTIWQRNYHEHIIRNEKSYKTISEYIINNPAKWQYDKFYKQ
jgi:REP element-mobilizing transposase RayT